MSDFHENAIFKNHADQWLVAAQYFADNFEAVE